MKSEKQIKKQLKDLIVVTDLIRKKDRLSTMYFARMGYIDGLRWVLDKK